MSASKLSLGFCGMVLAHSLACTRSDAIAESRTDDPGSTSEVDPGDDQGAAERSEASDATTTTEVGNGETGPAQSTGFDTPVPDAEQPHGSRPVQLSGAVQKGPFIVGSTVTVSNLDALGNPTGAVFATATSDDLGQFSLAFDATEVVAIEGSGFYYNEATGSLSVSPITLRALYGVREAAQQTVYVNLITHLTFERVAALVVGGVALPDARAQAERELREALAIVPPALEVGVDGASMNILGGDSDANAYLFAVSAVLARAAQLESPDAADAALQELVNSISLDLADAGGIEAGRRARIAAALSSLDTTEIETALAARLVALDSPADVPDLDRILDQDADGLLNVADNCPTFANALQEDLDGDALGDLCDGDRDGDGVANPPLCSTSALECAQLFDTSWDCSAVVWCDSYTQLACDLDETRRILVRAAGASDWVVCEGYPS